MNLRPGKIAQCEHHETLREHHRSAYNPVAGFLFNCLDGVHLPSDSAIAAMNSRDSTRQSWRSFFVGAPYQP